MKKLKRDMIKKIKEKGLSPVIATVLLVAMVIIMGLIVFLWMKGSINEVIYKFADQNIELSCADVSFEAEYSPDGNLYVVNNADVPIRDFKVQVITGGTKTTFDILTDIDNSFIGISSGNGEDFNISDKVGDAEELLVIPVLQGRNDAGTLKTYVCDETYGQEVFITSS